MLICDGRGRGPHSLSGQRARRTKSSKPIGPPEIFLEYYNYFGGNFTDDYNDDDDEDNAKRTFDLIMIFVGRLGHGPSRTTSLQRERLFETGPIFLTRMEVS